ncbi:hypothetical protein F8388_027302 [Cannabis sativa]|uniref:Uncharacterized protein n=1 Tax=Cannabis sativa TaxID=3483 RepID=A0A7J6FS56_CANSA|nr:hypothetical protein F8388_027302 [Cannabis sativa]
MSPMDGPFFSETSSAMAGFLAFSQTIVERLSPVWCSGMICKELKLYPVWCTGVIYIHEKYLTEVNGDTAIAHFVLKVWFNGTIPGILQLLFEMLRFCGVVLWLQDEAKKALEGALGGKKNEFEKWNKEIKQREEAGGGGDAGGGGWFGWGGRFGWSNDDNFWQEAQQASLAVLGILIMYLIVAKGEVMLAVVFNPLLYVLRGTRNGLTSVTSRISGRTSPSSFNDSDIKSNEAYNRVSAKDRVSSKWGN